MASTTAMYGRKNQRGVNRITAVAMVAFHAGAIALARGDSSGGRALLEGALADGPALDPIEREEALALTR